MTNQWPAFFVLSGPQAGQCFSMRTDTFSVGRNPECALQLASASVSREHLRVSRQGDQVVVWDVGSSNGTFVNGNRLVGAHVLSAGERLRLGDVELQFVVMGAPTTSEPQPPPRSNVIGDVSGSVNTGDPVNRGRDQIVGDGRIYHGNVHHGDRFDVDVDSDQSLEELFAGKGFGRLLMAIGLVVAFVGFGIWMSLILSGMTANDPNESPFDDRIVGLSKPVVGFSMFAAGAVLARLGAGMSKAARKREERRRWS